jgi:hypothetical protein
MDVRQIQEDLVAWIRSQGLAYVRVEDAPQTGAGFPNVILAGPHVITQVGQDWVQNADTAEGESTPTVVGNRELHFSVRVIDRSHSMALSYLEKLRASLKKPSVLTALAEANIAVVKLGPTSRTTPVNTDGRVESVASADLRIATTIAEVDSATGTIDTVAVSSTIEDSAGNVLPAPPNLVDEIIG